MIERSEVPKIMSKIMYFTLSSSYYDALIQHLARITTPSPRVINKIPQSLETRLFPPFVQLPTRT